MLQVSERPFREIGQAFQPGQLFVVVAPQDGELICGGQLVSIEVQVKLH